MQRFTPAPRGRLHLGQGIAAALPYADDTALAHNARFLAAVVPELEREQQIQYGNLNISEGVIGTTPDFIKVRNYTLAAGRMFTAKDDAERQRYAVIEADIPDLFKTNGAAMIGQTIKIRGIEFEVLGVLVAKGTQGFGSTDDDILIPLQTAPYPLAASDRLRQITIRAASPDSIPPAMIEIERVLPRQHTIKPAFDNNFRIRSARDVLSTLEQTTVTFKYLLGGVAAVSLLVGGIGIMNIMLVSVTERTREIGVRKALGATRVNILLQFVVEAA